MLGLQTYHMETTVRNERHNELWLDALKAKYEGGEPFTRDKWDQILGNYAVRLISALFSRSIV